MFTTRYIFNNNNDNNNNRKLSIFLLNNTMKAEQKGKVELIN